MGLIPVLVLTGFLGAGKTTLLNRILGEAHGKRFAVIVNEFGAIGIDQDLVIGSGEELFEMSNGCICCAVRGDLIRTVRQLLDRKDFDAIIIETSGLAAPAPIVQSFFMDQELLARTEIASVTTLADARHVRLRLQDSPEAREQIAFADQIILNKTDLADEEELTGIEEALRQINPLAPILRANHGDVDLDALLSRRGYDLSAIEFDEGGHRHSQDIETVSLRADRPLDAEKTIAWLEKLTAERGKDLLRGKGIIDAAGDERRLVFHSVHNLLDGDWQREWKPGEPRYSRVVFIGRNLDPLSLQIEFDELTARL